MISMAREVEKVRTKLTNLEHKLNHVEKSKGKSVIEFEVDANNFFFDFQEKQEDQNLTVTMFSEVFGHPWEFSIELAIEFSSRDEDDAVWSASEEMQYRMLPRRGRVIALGGLAIIVKLFLLKKTRKWNTLL